MDDNVPFTRGVFLIGPLIFVLQTKNKIVLIILLDIVQKKNENKLYYRLKTIKLITNGLLLSNPITMIVIQYVFGTISIRR